MALFDYRDGGAGQACRRSRTAPGVCVCVCVCVCECACACARAHARVCVQIMMDGWVVVMRLDGGGLSRDGFG